MSRTGGGGDLAPAGDEANRQPAPRQLHAERRRPRDRQLEGLGARPRVVVEDDRRLAPLVVLVLAHQQHSAPRAGPPVDAARIVSRAKRAQPRQLAVPARPLLARGRRRRRQPPQEGRRQRGQRREDHHLRRVLHLARPGHEPERKLGRQPEPRQLVAPAAADRVPVGGLLRAPGRELQEVAALVDRAPLDEILDLDRERRQPALPVLERDPHQVGRAGMNHRRQDPAHAQPAEPQRRHQPVRRQQAGHHPERQEEEVDPRVDRHRADEQRRQQEPPPLAGGGELAFHWYPGTLGGFPRPPATSSAEQSSAPLTRIIPGPGGDRGFRRARARRPAATAPPPRRATPGSPGAPAPAPPAT